MFIKLAIVSFTFAASLTTAGIIEVQKHKRAESFRNAIVPCITRPNTCLGGYVVWKDTRITRIDDGSHEGPKVAIHALATGDDTFLGSIEEIVLPFDPRWIGISVRYIMQQRQLQNV